MRMKKSLIFVPFVISVFFISCHAPKDISKDGGLSFLIQASVQDIIRLNALPGDTLVNSAIKRTEAVINGSDSTFLEQFIRELYKNSNGSDIHFKGLRPNVPAAECSEYLIKKTGEATEELKGILLKRMNLLIPEDISVQSLGNKGRIMVLLPGVSAHPHINEVLLARGNFEFWETFDNKEVFPVLEKVNTRLKELSDAGNLKIAQDTTVMGLDSSMSLEEQMARIDKGTVNKLTPGEALKLEHPLFGILAPSVLQDGNNTYLADGPVIGYSTIADTARVNSYLQNPGIKSLLPPKLKFAWGFKPVDSQGNIIQLVALSAKNINGGPALNGKFIENARKIKGDAAQQISIKMTPAAAVTWQNITRDNIGKSIAIMLDGKVCSFPVVQSEIEGGMSSITGNFTQEEANGIVNVLSSGTLPVRITLLEEKTIAPLKK